MSRRNRTGPALALALAVLAGCVTVTTSSIGTFVGVLPCADCAGILTELKLYAEQPSGRATRYELTETYLGARDGGGSIGTTGRWDTSGGSVVLDLGRVDARKNFLRVGDDELRLLDRSQREISSKAPHSLHRVSELPPVTLLESDSGQVLEVDRGQRVYVALGANRTTGYGWMLEAPPGALTSLGGSMYVQEAALPGAGGTEIWFFGAGRSGKMELVFHYRRASDPGPPARTVTFTVSVR
jgi:copper homeostasis protein (lipoprotein)